MTRRARGALGFVPLLLDRYIHPDELLDDFVDMMLRCWRCRRA